MNLVKIWGLPCSGTNFLSCMLERSFGVVALNSVLGWKHGPPVLTEDDEKWKPDPRIIEAGGLPSHAKPLGWRDLSADLVQTLVGTPEEPKAWDLRIPQVAIVRHPEVWLASCTDYYGVEPTAHWQAWMTEWWNAALAMYRDYEQNLPGFVCVRYEDLCERDWRHRLMDRLAAWGSWAGWIRPSYYSWPNRACHRAGDVLHGDDRIGGEPWKPRRNRLACVGLSRSLRSYFNYELRLVHPSDGSS